MAYPKQITPEAEEYIKANYLSMIDKKIGEQIGVSKVAVCKYRKKNGLEKPKRKAKPKTPKRYNRFNDMIKFAKDELKYDNSAEAVWDLGSKAFKQLYVNQLKT